MIDETIEELKQVKQTLEELQKELNDWKDGTIIVKWCEAEEKCKVLENQLAEKEKEIISLECVIFEIHQDIEDLHKFKVGEDEYDLTDEDERFYLKCELENKEPDKISFAIEKLREIKNEIDNNAFDSREEECKVVSHFKANTIIQKKIEELENDTTRSEG